MNVSPFRAEHIALAALIEGGKAGIYQAVLLRSHALLEKQVTKKKQSHLSKLFLFQFQDDLLGHFLVDVAVAAEGAGVLDVAGDLGDEVGVLDLFV